MESKRIGEEIEILLGTQTTREKSLAKKFRSNDAVKVIKNIYTLPGTHFFNENDRNFATFKRERDARIQNALNYTSRR